MNILFLPPDLTPLSDNPELKDKLSKILLDFRTPPEKGITWTVEGEGVAKQGEFSYLTEPKFQINFPQNAERRHLRSANQVMAMRTILGSSFSASVRDIPAGATVEKIGVEDYVNALEVHGNGLNIKVVSNERITLQDGTIAYKTDIEWCWNSSFILRTLVVSVLKKNKWVSVDYNLVASNKVSIPKKINEGEKIVESQRFD